MTAGILTELRTNRAVLYALLERGWAILSNAFTIVLVFHFLSPGQQGFFTTFRNLVALRIIFELGFAYVAVQMTSHEMVGVRIEQGVLVGEKHHLRRLSSLLRLMVKWYGIAALGYLAILLPLGISFFSQDKANTNVTWQIPWSLTVLATAGTVFLSPLLAMLEGMGLVAEVAFFRFITNFFGAWLVWLCLILGLKLFSVSVLLLPELLAGVGYVLIIQRKLFRGLLEEYDPSDVISWRDEIFPFQWRIALSWMAGYLQYQIFGPIVFHFRGSVEAGRLGLSLNAMSAISAIAIAWVQTKAPAMGKLIAAKDFESLNKLFFPALYQVVAVSSFVAFSIDAVVWALWLTHNPYAIRLLDPLSFTLLSLGVVSNAIITCQALYLRAHKQEPFLVMGVSLATCLTIGAVLAAKLVGASGVAMTYFILMSLFLIPSTMIFQAKRALWHRSEL